MKPTVNHGRGTTATVRKILQSQKTFEHHLDDFINGAVPTLLPLEAAKPTSSAPIGRGTTTQNLTSKGTRSHKRKDPNVAPTSTPLRKVSSAAQLATPSSTKGEPSTKEDVEMTEAPLLAQGNSTIPASHPGDKDPLLVSRIPSMPSEAEIEKLLAAPPLSYLEARGSLVEEDRRKPPRKFCMNCGYWGRVKCIRCGGRVCALECLQKHQEDCYGRYGA
jgi:zinc finger HIT domain-containing protein 1